MTWIAEHARIGRSGATHCYVTLSWDIRTRWARREIATDLYRVPPEQIAIGMPKIKGAIRLDLNGFKCHFRFELIGGQFCFFLIEPIIVLER